MPHYLDPPVTYVKGIHPEFSCGCDAMEGYGLALRQVLGLVDFHPVSAEISDDAKAAVGDERHRLRTAIRLGINLTEQIP